MVGASKGGEAISMTVIKLIHDDRPSIPNVLEMSEKFHSLTGSKVGFNRNKVAVLVSGLCDSERGKVIVAIDKFGNRVGFVAGHCSINHMSGELIAEELAIWVEPEYRRCGAGDKLMDEFEHWASKEARAAHIRVTAQAGLRMAGVVKWFKSRGFHEVEMVLSKEVIY